MEIRFGWYWYLIKRSVKHWWQRRTRGWDDSATWNLNHHVAKFTLPRLKRWKELGACGYPHKLTPEIWDAYIDEMIYALESDISDCDMTDDWDTIDWKRVTRGHKLFGKYFRDLWD